MKKRVGGGSGGAQGGRRPHDPAVDVGEKLHHRLVRIDGAALGLEADELDHRRAVLHARAGRRGAPYGFLDLGAHGGGLDAGEKADAHLEGAFGGHRRRPFAAADDAEVEVDGVGEAVVGAVARILGVPALLESLERRDQVEGGLDGVDPGRGVEHVGRLAAHSHAKPHHPHLGRHQALLEGLGDDRGVGLVAARQAGERAVAGAFLLDHRLQIDRRGGLHADVAERLERHGVGDDAGFHVANAAAVEAAVAHHRLEGRVGPHVLGSGRHHVDMAVEDQRAPGVTPRLVDADDVFLARVAPVHRREARLILDGVHVYLELVDGQPEPGEDFRHVVLGRGLVAERRAVAHQIGQHRHRLVVQRVGGGDDLRGARRGVHRG